MTNFLHRSQIILPFEATADGGERNQSSPDCVIDTSFCCLGTILILVFKSCDLVSVIYYDQLIKTIFVVVTSR